MPAIRELSSMVLPDEVGFRRDYLVPPDARGPAFEARYDRLTLVYDAFNQPQEGVVRLVCPNPLNLAPLLQNARFTLDGRRVRARRLRRHSRHHSLDLVAPEGGERLVIEVDGWAAELRVSRPETAFDQLNCLVTLSKDNDLRWIRDWARFHAAEHGAEGVLLFDNGSTSNPPQAIEAALAGVPGLREVAVVSVPLPFGPVATRGRRHESLYLQAGLLNIARQRFLGRARAVLVCDIDELVIGQPPIFDAAVASRAGYVMVPREWRFPAVSGDALPLHRDHVLRRDDAPRCAPKYCVVPGGRLRGRAWKTHRVAGIWFSQLYRSRRHLFLHCQGISRFWKGGGSRPPVAASVAGTVDRASEAVLRRGLD